MVDKAEFKNLVEVEYQGLQRGNASRESLLKVIEADTGIINLILASRGTYESLGICSPDLTQYLVNICAAATKMNDPVWQAPGKQSAIEMLDVSEKIASVITTQESPDVQPENMGQALVKAVGQRGRPRKVQPVVEPEVSSQASSAVEAKEPKVSDEVLKALEDVVRNPVNPIEPKPLPASVDKPVEELPPVVPVLPEDLTTDKDGYLRDKNGYQVVQPCGCLTRTTAQTPVLYDEKRVFVTKGNYKGIPEGYYLSRTTCRNCQGSGFEPKKAN
jgi:hypothetical protein